MNKKMIVLITGATRGIGAELTKRYLEKGYTVFGIYKKSVSIAARMESTYANLKLFQVDLGEKVQVSAFVRKIQKLTPVVDIIINNAGIYVGGGVKTLNSIDLQYSLSVNVMSKFILTQSLLPLLKMSKQPKVINISSRFGFIGNADPDSLAYNLSNSAITMMSIAMQKEFQNEGVLIGCYVPTVTKTDRFLNAFTTKERIEIKKSGMLATKQDTAKKIVSFIGNLTGKGVVIDKRVSTEHLQCMQILSL
jgi:NAD(P)-dependent dehydrogenase (short-subunit alcohol dehydrogenase family)